MDPKDEIKAKLDIVAVIGEYLELKPAGMHGFRALCPFHAEKSASFHVSSDRQIFHCFGCGEGGDIFTFVQKMEGMDFPEVLMHLGQKAGVEIKRFSTTEGNTKQRLMGIHELATSFYKKVLSSSSGSHVAREYLANRGITSELIDRFEIGFAPDDWSMLSDALLKRGFSEAELVQAGLSIKKKSGIGVLDRFRARIMIPLRDQHGNTVGFTGRQLPGADSNMGKYVNSPETLIYHKGRLVYGLDLAKRAIKDHKCLIIMEGNLDVVASNKIGVQHVVASSGTALTQEQLELIKRYTDTVVFCFDRDAAGLTAAKKGVTIARSLSFDVRAISLPTDVKDPDDLVQKNPEVWKKLSNESIPFMQYLFDRTLFSRDISNVDHKRLISQELLPAISEISDVVEREHWLAKLASLLNIDLAILRTAIHPKLEKSVIKTNTNSVHPIKLGKKDQVLLVLIGSILNDELNRDYVRKQLELTVIDHEQIANLYKFLEETYTSDIETAKTKSFFAKARNLLQSDPSKETLLSLLDQSSLIAEQQFENLSPASCLTQLNTLFETLHATDRQSKRSILAQKLRQAEDAGDVEAVNKLLSELN
ncbi:DNA primase [Candidatus Uhrbacteria bacterium RIFCSPHIGHO2_12_FULL_47_12]|uniref:DNA primase n=1 Tax=Candidatus Uhrbacteria bacterium RIFCSPLOWO2_02_FULL_48_18 TaxID=1802408 RepID=A0A1F7VAV5_9BACT|nr:MAG: DNA primase [Candidatus Uhrbacteria bacterium RIFCSPHIGHO2_12_FULL_47_12]OGL81931.1 MAG: DNA primase [Candidatus Uhrbacteria bacterium RIFCSPLOWO2_01_FULL_47_17]OGL87094.1 MAG: DNA primase [Candidatus Uhrbacteria bacterium RIFCSPLOWO2_02_FULL_48_18]